MTKQDKNGVIKKMPAIIKTSTHKLGRGGSRLWLEGQRLLDHKFDHGRLFKKTWGKSKLTLELVDLMTWCELPFAERATVSGSLRRPIIDITGAKMAGLFRQHHPYVNVRWEPGKLTVTHAR
jgi:hypothetical protein